jgi:glycosyltransferase involved in cell wall biosynthesis
MKVLYFDPKFLTPRHAAPTRAYSIARRLVERGHRVTMVARDPRWLAVGEPPPPAGLLSTRESVDGIDVLWMRIPYEQRFSKAQRLISYGAYTLAASAATVGLGRPDIVYASSTPLTSGIPGVFASRLRGVPFVFEIQDLWPALPAALGFLNGKLELALAEWLERELYAKSERVVVCSEEVVAELVQGGVAREKLVLVPNFSDTDLFRPETKDATFKSRHGLEGKFVAVYAGAMGISNGVDQLADAASVLKERGEDDVRILAVGDGSERPALERRIREEGLENLLVLEPVPREYVPALIGSCDAALTVFAPHPALRLNSPNKFFDSLAAGKPVVVNVDGWLRRIVEENDAGVYAPAGDGEALAAALVSLARHPGRLAEMGMKARALAEREFARDVLADRLAETLEEVAARRQVSNGSRSR